MPCSLSEPPPVRLHKSLFQIDDSALRLIESDEPFLEEEPADLLAGDPQAAPRPRK